MTMILGGLDMTRYRTQLGIGTAKDAHSRRAAVDAGLFFDFDPRKARNHKLRGPLQTPFRVVAVVDGRSSTFKMPKGTSMDNVGAMVARPAASFERERAPVRSPKAFHPARRRRCRCARSTRTATSACGSSS